MSRFSTKTLVYLALVTTFACGDNQASPDAGDIPDAAVQDLDAPVEQPDAMSTTDAMTTTDATPEPAGIEEAVAAADGVQDPVLAINNVWVTYTKPAIGNDVAGFFVQDVAEGPALFIAVDPTSLTPIPAVGDEVSFTIDEMDTSFDLRQAVAISDLTVQSSGGDVSGLIQDVSDAADLVTALNDYTSELVAVTGTLTSDLGGAGTGHLKADFDTAAIVGNPDLSLRMPEMLANELNLMMGCTFSTTGTPLWRFRDEVQAHIWTSDELENVTCPPPVVVGAVATSDTEVVVEFDRAIDPASVTDAPNQFTIPSLTVSAAAVSGRLVTLTTSDQVGGDPYTVTVAVSVMDIFGAALDGANNTAMFNGFLTPATIRINEIAANEANNCDLLELRIIDGGSLEGFQVTERTSTILTFPTLVVNTNDFVILHFDNADCNPDGAADETMAADEQPVATYSTNFDTAYDLYMTDTGMTSTDNVITLLNPSGAIVDAVLLSDNATGTAANGSESQAAVVAAAGEWENVGGGTPPGGYIDEAFSSNAVLDLNGPDTIQRIDDNDTNTKDDWTATNAAATWGMLNAGQTAN